jgi:hypothetical protein
MTTPMREKQLLLNCPDFETFVQRFTAAGFNKDYQQSKLYSHLRNLWTRREIYITEIEEATKTNHTVMVPKEIRTKAPDAPRSSPFYDDDMQVKIYNQLVYNGQLLKEQVEALRALMAKVDSE